VESGQAGSSLEKMLCHQMAARHRAAMWLVARIGEGGLPIVESARLSNAVARMMQVYQEAFLTLQKIRTGGRQTVRVQHVQVSEGGQAVIAGSVKSGSRKDRQGVEGKKGGYTPMNRGRAWLKNNNPVADLTKASRCGAKTRRGTSCQCPAMPNGRCRLHGGLSTGPRTTAGIERIRQAVTKHGRYSKRARGEREHYRKLLQHWREMLAAISGNRSVAGVRQ
jgi:hypothetical protein